MEGTSFAVGKNWKRVELQATQCFVYNLLCDTGPCVMTQAIGMSWKQHDAWMVMFIDWPVCAFG